MSVTEPGLRAQVQAAAERLEALSPGYLARVRRSASRLGVRSGSSDNLDVLLEDVADQARIDVEVTTASRRRPVVYLKKAVKALIRWYLRYLAQQMTAFGESVSRLGRELVARTEAVEARSESLGRSVDALSDDVETLRRRVDRLEGESGDGTAVDRGPR
jgi:hypothetical protein